MIDAIVPEPEGGAHLNPDEAARLLGEPLGETLDELAALAGRASAPAGASDSARWASIALSARNPLCTAVPDGFPQAAGFGSPQHPQCFPLTPDSTSRPAKAGLDTLTPCVVDEALSGRTSPDCAVYLSVLPKVKHPLRDSRRSLRVHTTMRPIWSGTISFGLVSVPVRMYSATESKELRFHFLHKEDLQPIGYDKVRQGHRQARRPRRDRPGLRDRQGPLRPARGRGPRPARHRADPLDRHLRLRRPRGDRPALLPQGVLPASAGRRREAVPAARARRSTRPARSGSRRS